MAVNLTTRRIFTNLKHIKFTPWTSESELGQEVYDITNLVGDTTSVEQEENEENTIESEFSAAPLYENIKLGKKSFTTECADMQAEILKGLFGWSSEASDANVLGAPVAYKDLYCKIEIAFNSTEDIVVLPKVRLNSRLAMAQMKSDVSRGHISGTCYNAYVNKTLTDFAIVTKAGASTYKVGSTASA